MRYEQDYKAFTKARVLWELSNMEAAAETALHNYLKAGKRVPPDIQLIMTALDYCIRLIDETLGEEHTMKKAAYIVGEELKRRKDPQRRKSDLTYAITPYISDIFNYLVSGDPDYITDSYKEGLYVI